MGDGQRLNMLERQLAVFAKEFAERMDVEEGLRKQIAASHQVLSAQLAELRDVYLMHKRHLEETIEIINLVRALADQLESQIARGYVSLNTAQAAAWYKAFRLMSKQSAKSLIRQKHELAPYLDENWKPPATNTWDGQVEVLAEQASATRESKELKAPTAKAKVPASTAAKA